MISRQSSFLPHLLITLSLAINLHALAEDSLWGDEILTATFANQSVTEVIWWTAQDIHPPLYYLIAGTFTRFSLLLGPPDAPAQVSDWVWRFPSVLAVVVTVAVTYRLAYYVGRPGPHFIALSTALLLCVAPLAVKYGQEARMHALFMFLAAFSTLLLFRALAQPRRRSRWLAFALATTAHIYTMYFGFLILAAHLGFGILEVGFRLSALRFMKLKKLKLQITDYQAIITGFSASIAIAFILYLPWWPVLFTILRQRAAVGAIEGGVGSPLTFITRVVWTLGPTPPAVAWGFLTLFCIGLIFLAGSYWPISALAALWLALPIIWPILLGDPRALQFRYAFILPLYLLIIAYVITKISTMRRASGSLSLYLIWLLSTLSFIATLNHYHQTKPNWREAAAYLNAHTQPVDIILTGPLWDEGRFIGYYYRGQAQLLTPAALVTNIQGQANSLRANGGRVWAVNRFVPGQSPALRNIEFSGVVISEPTLPVYEPDLLAGAAIDLARQAVDAAYSWAAEAEAQGVLNPDPRTAQAIALQGLGDALVAAGHLPEAVEAYQRAVDIFPGWVQGFIVLAETQERVGNLPAAANAYRQAVTFNLAWQGPCADEAAGLVESGRWRAAIEKYHQIMDGRTGVESCRTQGLDGRTGVESCRTQGLGGRTGVESCGTQGLGGRTGVESCRTQGLGGRTGVESCRTQGLYGRPGGVFCGNQVTGT